MTATHRTDPHVVIVGAGFGGLAAARALKHAAVRITVVDRSNHHLFQPLLYQVATAALSPGQIASPIRALLRRQPNTTVLMGEVTGVDKEARRVFATDGNQSGSATYDFLILATGVRHSYFNHPEFEPFAPGLKTLSDAVSVRNNLLAAPTAQWLHVPADRAGRVCVQPDLTIPGYPDVFVIGDVARFEQDGSTLPGVAQVAIQQGRYAARAIRRRLAGQPPQQPFRYFDKGSMAVVGKNFAVLESGRFKLSGLLAFFAWGGVHLQFLAQASLRATVFLQWMWMYVTNQPGSRLIIRHRDRPVAASARHADERLHV